MKKHGKQKKGDRGGEVNGEDWMNSGIMKKRVKHRIIAYESNLSQTVDK